MVLEGNFLNNYAYMYISVYVDILFLTCCFVKEMQSTTGWRVNHENGFTELNWLSQEAIDEQIPGKLPVMRITKYSLIYVMMFHGLTYIVMWKQCRHIWTGACRGWCCVH